MGQDMQKVGGPKLSKADRTGRYSIFERDDRAHCRDDTTNQARPCRSKAILERVAGYRPGLVLDHLNRMAERRVHA
jgi:hypothetical protein